MRYVVALLPLVLCSPTAVATGADLSSPPAIRGLAVRFVMPPDPPPQTGAAWVVLEKDGQCLARQGTRFRKAVVFKEAPPGEKVIVHVVPFFLLSPWGLAGKAETEVPEQGVGELPIPLEALKSTRVHVAITGWDGEPYAEKRIGVRDAAVGEGHDAALLETDQKGRVSFLAFPGRRYLLEENLGFPGTPIRFALDVRREGKNEFSWQINPGTVTYVRFFEIRKNRRLPFTAMDRIFIYTEEHAWSALVQDGGLTLYRDLGRLRDAEQIRLVLKPAQADYDIVENQKIALTHEKKQVVDVVLKKHVYATFRIEGLDPQTRTPVALSAYALDPDTGKVISGAGPGREFRLGPGRYTIALWQRGYRLVKRSVHVTREETFEWDILLQKAPELGVAVTDTAGRLLHEHVVLRMRHNDAPYLDDQWGRLTEDHTFAVPVDDRLDPLLRIKTPKHGTRLVAVSPADVQKGLEVRLDPKTVTGTVTIGEEVGDGKRTVLVWAPKAFPRFPVAASPVEDGRYEVFLEPGRYIPYVVNARHAMPLDEVQVTGEPAQTLPPVNVTSEEWKEQKRPQTEFLERF